MYYVLEFRCRMPPLGRLACACALDLYCAVSRGGLPRIDAAVMLWTATHLGFWAGLGNIAVAAVVRNGSRHGRRSGSPASP